jgi:membrane-bound lytic murein transglycosylase D
MKRYHAWFLLLLTLGCSSRESLRTGSSLQAEQVLPPSVDSTQPSVTIVSADTLQKEKAETPSLPAVAIVDTVLHQRSTQLSEPDTADNQQLYVSHKLEEARQHYLGALSAQDIGDSVLCANEFENSIKALNELSYLPGIDANKDFADLSKNVLDDYEKYIANIGNLGPGASVFALREKLSQIIEKVDISKMVVPKEEVHGTTIALPFNEQVERNIAFFTGERGRSYFEKWLILSGKYFPMMKRVFRSEGIPEELVFLSMIESGLRPDARSWVKAVGLWQFMKGTGSLYGLNGNWWYDERRDFEKSTYAAARHLKDLYSEYGDWYVVLAAYNSGAAKVYKAIHSSGSKDYWEMRKYLPRQTRNYVPEFIAVVRMYMAPEQYGFRRSAVSDSLSFEIVTINDCVDLRVLAQCAETSLDNLRELNPELLQLCTPPGVTGYRLRIPSGKAGIFASNFVSVPPDQKRDWTVHTVRRGETPSNIAKHYGLTASLLTQVNSPNVMKKLSAGSQLAIPLPKELTARHVKVPFDYDKNIRGMDFTQIKAYVAKTDISRNIRTAPKHLKSPSGKERLAYRVKRGDSIGYVAEWYGVRASDVRNWNDIPYGSMLPVNKELTIWVDPRKASTLEHINEMSFAEKQSGRKERLIEAGLFNLGATTTTPGRENGWVQYKIRPGETLEKIASEHGVSIAELKSWNKLPTSRIMAGQSLDIYTLANERTKLVGTSPRPTPAGRSEARNSRPSLAANSVYYRVKRGDTLSEIAVRYKVSVKELERANDVSDGLKAGERIKIPRY